mgnify:CR=1 FL=1
MKKFTFLFISILTSSFAFCQKEYHFHGYIASEEQGITLSNARVFVETDTVETLTNNAGYFNLVVSNDTFIVSIEKQGYMTRLLKVVLNEDGQRPSSISHNSSQNDKKNGYFTIYGEELVILKLEEIFNNEYTIFFPPSLTDREVHDVQSDKIVLNRAELDHLPFIFSEPDVTKALQYSPGVEFAIDGLSDMTVRGGGLGQNQILLNGVPVYGLGHLMGYVSNFNSNMTDEVTLYKAAFPARYGGRLASVMEVSADAGNAEDATIDIAVSPVLGNLNVGLPLGINGSSLGISFRRSYVDILFQLPGQELFVRDFNTKLNIVVNEKDRLILNFYSLRDRVKFSGQDTSDSTGMVDLEFEIDLVSKNQTMSAQYLHVHNKRLSGSATAYYTNFSNGVSLKETDFSVPIGSNAISDYSVKFSAGEVGLNTDFELRKDKKTMIRFGLQNRLHLSNSGSSIEKRYDIAANLLSDNQYGDTILQKGFETSLYGEYEYEHSKKLKFNAGLRTTLYTFKGFTGLYPEPRFSGRYIIDKSSSIRLSYARVNQYVHLFNTDGSAQDQFVSYLPATENLKPQKSNIFTLGFAKRPNADLTLLSEFYYKTLGNQPIFYASDVFDRNDIEANSLVGTGEVIGWENSMKFTLDNTMLFASVSLSNATRQYEELNRGDAFSFDYDRRFIGKVGFVYNYDRFVMSATGVFATGNPYTLPTSKYRDVNGDIVLAYDEINNYRSVEYSRIDAKVEWFLRDEIQSIEFMVYNLLGTDNVQSIFSQRDSTSTNSRYIAYARSSFRFIPFLTYRLRIN